MDVLTTKLNNLSLKYNLEITISVKKKLRYTFKIFRTLLEGKMLRGTVISGLGGEGGGGGER